jgi:hypothetical protein
MVEARFRSMSTNLSKPVPLTSRQSRMAYEKCGKIYDLKIHICFHMY